MKFLHLSVLAASVALLGTSPAHAVESNWSMALTKNSKVKGTLKEKFEAGDTLDLSLDTWANFEPYIALGKDFLNPNGTFSCMKPGMTLHYLCIRGVPQSKQPGPGSTTVSFADSSYFGFRWGTVDWNQLGGRWNQVSLYNGDSLIETVTGMQVHPVLKALQPDATGDLNGYFNWYAPEGQVVNKVVFWSSVSSFEIDEIAIKTAPVLAAAAAIAPVGQVPEPSTYALMAAGLGFVGWVAARRRRG